MAAKTAEQRRLAAQVAASVRWGKDDAGPRRELATNALEAHIRRVVAEAPPLSDAQKARLTTLLNSPPP